MPILLDNKILKAAEDRIESQLVSDVRDDYLKIVVAGMRTAADKGPNGILSGLKARKDPITDCAIGAINLVLLMKQHARGVMPVKAMVPAAMTLMLQGLDLVDKAGIAKVGAAELARATRIFNNHLFNVLKITPAVLQNMGTKVHAVMQDPAHMDLIARKAGVVKAPGASTLPPAMRAKNG